MFGVEGFEEKERKGKFHFKKIYLKLIFFKIKNKILYYHITLFVILIVEKIYKSLNAKIKIYLPFF